jgi:hypothetical protein
MMSLYRPNKYKQVPIPEKSDSEKFSDFCFEGDLEAARNVLKKYCRIRQLDEVRRIVQYREPTVSVCIV